MESIPKKSYFAKELALRTLFGDQAFIDLKKLLDPCCGGGDTLQCPCPAIYTTLVGMQAFIASNTVVFPATYVITDLTDGGGVFQSTGSGSINPVGVGYYFVPNYTIAGLSMGQLLNGLPVVAGEKWIWGNLIWTNLNGNNPATTSPLTLDPVEWTQVPKSVANGYLLQQFIIEVDISTGNLVGIQQPSEQNYYKVPSFILTNVGLTSLPIQWANFSITSLINNCTYNNRVLGTGNIINNTEKNLELLSIYTNTVEGTISNNELHAGSLISNIVLPTGEIAGNVIYPGSYISENILSGWISDNHLHPTSSIYLNTLNDLSKIYRNTCKNASIAYNVLSNECEIAANEVYSTCSIANNTLSSPTSFTIPQIAFCQLNDNCHIDNNTLSGAGACIWDVWAGENCYVTGNVLSGDEVVQYEGCLIADIKMMQDDYLRNCTLSGLDCKIDNIHLKGYSIIENVTLAEAVSRMSGVTLGGARVIGGGSTFSNFTISLASGKKGYTNLNLVNSSLSNGADFNISNSNFEGATIDFTGWTRDIDGLSMINGKGTFTYTHDFTLNPLATGSLLINYLPAGATATNISWAAQGLGGTAGASMSLGIENDDPFYGFAPTAIGLVASGEVNIVSAITIAPRSLVIDQPTVGETINNGVLTVTITFIY